MIFNRDRYPSPHRAQAWICSWYLLLQQQYVPGITRPLLLFYVPEKLTLFAHKQPRISFIPVFFFFSRGCQAFHIIFIQYLVYYTIRIEILQLYTHLVHTYVVYTHCSIRGTLVSYDVWYLSPVIRLVRVRQTYTWCAGMINRGCLWANRVSFSGT